MDRRTEGSTLAVVLAFAAVAAVTGFFLLRYPVQQIRYPVGWDAPWYVWRAKAVAFDGLSRLGTVRAANPLAISMLMRATGQNAFTIVAIAGPLYAGIAGVAVAAMLRASLGSSPLWLPAFALITWVGFGGTGLLNGYLDQTLNVALVLAGFGAAVAFIADRRGALASALLLMAAGLAEWPFYVFAALILCGSLLIYVVTSRRGSREAFASTRPLFGAVLASGAFTALSLVGIPSIGNLDLKAARGPESLGFGKRLSPTPNLRRLLRERFLLSIEQPRRFLGLFLALVGGFAVVRAEAPPGRQRARRFLVALMASWVALTAVAAVAQLAGAPVAGARLLLYLFAVPVLVAALVWAVGRFARGRLSTALGVAVATIVVLGAVAALATATWRGDHRRTWLSARIVAQLTAAGEYLTTVAPDRAVVFSFGQTDGTTRVRWRNTVKAGLPPSVVPRIQGFEVGLVLDPQLPGGWSGGLRQTVGSSGGPVVMVLEVYDHVAFEQGHQTYPESFVSPGVLALNGPTSPSVISEATPVKANTRGLHLLWVVALSVAALFAAGGGWAIVLLPSDPVVRAGLAPALGLGMSVLVALVWDRLSLGLGGWWGIGPMVVVTAAGWILAALTRRRPGRSGTAHA
jgi:hypothetical protein